MTTTASGGGVKREQPVGVCAWPICDKRSWRQEFPIRGIVRCWFPSWRKLPSGWRKSLRYGVVPLRRRWGVWSRSDGAVVSSLPRRRSRRCRLRSGDGSYAGVAERRRSRETATRTRDGDVHWIRQRKTRRMRIERSSTACEGTRGDCESGRSPMSNRIPTDWQGPRMKREASESRAEVRRDDRSQ